ncbi:MAG: acetoin utilization protein AcuC, partial [Paracoccaceae bacterium]
GSSLLAAELVANGGVAYAMGGGLHHGLVDRANGFCFLNDLVFAILRLRSLGLERIAYIDLDAHHCDGVQAAFSGDCDLLMVSTHEAKRWPFTGALSENIIDQQLNIPLLKNCNNEEFNLFFEGCILPALDRFAPEAIIIQGGADAVCDDPLSRLALSNYTLWNAVKRLKERCDKVILTGGGGYNPWTVARLWAGFWLVLNDRSPFIELPSGAQRVLESLSWQRKLRPSHDLITQLYDAPPEKSQLIRPETAALAEHIRDLHAL